MVVLHKRELLNAEELRVLVLEVINHPFLEESGNSFPNRLLRC